MIKLLTHYYNNIKRISSDYYLAKKTKGNKFLFK